MTIFKKQQPQIFQQKLQCQLKKENYWKRLETKTKWHYHLKSVFLPLGQWHHQNTPMCAIWSGKQKWSSVFHSNKLLPQVAIVGDT